MQLFPKNALKTIPYTFVFSAGGALYYWYRECMVTMHSYCDVGFFGYSVYWFILLFGLIGIPVFMFGLFKKPSKITNEKGEIEFDSKREFIWGKILKHDKPKKYLNKEERKEYIKYAQFGKALMMVCIIIGFGGAYLFREPYILALGFGMIILFASFVMIKFEVAFLRYFNFYIPMFLSTINEDINIPKNRFNRILGIILIISVFIITIVAMGYGLS